MPESLFSRFRRWEETDPLDAFFAVWMGLTLALTLLAIAAATAWKVLT